MPRDSATESSRVVGSGITNVSGEIGNGAEEFDGGAGTTRAGAGRSQRGWKRKSTRRDEVKVESGGVHGKEEGDM